MSLLETGEPWMTFRAYTSDGAYRRPIFGAYQPQMVAHTPPAEARFASGAIASHNHHDPFHTDTCGGTVSFKMIGYWCSLQGRRQHPGRSCSDSSRTPRHRHQCGRPPRATEAR